MRERMPMRSERWRVGLAAVMVGAIVMSAVGATFGISAGPTIAAVPGPVIAVDDGPSPEGPDGPGSDEGSDTDSSDSDGSPADDAPGEKEPPPGAFDDCLLQSAASAVRSPGGSGNVSVGRLTAYPGPVIPVDGGPGPASESLPPCPSTVSLALVVVARDERKPSGADASFDGETLPRPTLEAGYEADVPARTRTIRLSDPGEDWKLMDVSCTCAGGTVARIAARGPGAGPPVGRLTSYPGPVVAVPPANEPPGAQGGTAACPGASSSGSDVASWGSLAIAPGSARLTRVPLAGSVVPAASQGGSGAAQPNPVIPVEGDGPVAPPAEPPVEQVRRSPGSVEWGGDGTVTIRDPDQAGGAFSCIWTVEHGRGDLVLDTKTEPAGREGRFSYQAVPSVPGLRTETIRGSSPGAAKKMWKGAWSLTLQKPSDAWELESSECTEADPTTGSSAQGESATAGIDPSDRVSCTFEVKLLVPKEGQWRGNEPPTRLSCGAGVSFRIPRIRDTGQLRVRRDGMQLIARGLSQGNATWRLDRENEDSRRFSGQIEYAVAGGKATFTLDLDMLSEERLKGTFKGDMRVRGQRCTVDKRITIDYIGG